MRYISPSLLCLVLFVSSGCLRVSNLLDLKADGSGEITVKYSVSTQAIRQLQAMRTLRDHLERASGMTRMNEDEERLAYLFLLPDEAPLREELQAYEEHGITVEKLTVSSSGAWRTVDLKIKFESLRQLAQIEPFRYVGFDLRRDSNNNYVFYRASEPQEGYTPPNFNEPTVQRMLRPIFSGFKVVLSVRTPGRVIRTNAPHHSAYLSEWIYDFERDPSAISKIQTDKLVTIFESTGLNLPEIRH